MRRVAILEDAIDFAIIVTDPQGEVTGWNRGAEHILGWTAAEMLGQSLVRIFTPEDRAAGQMDAEMRDALAHGTASDERWHLRKDGTRLWASGTLMPLRGPGGAHEGFVKILRDRTAQRQSDMRLAESETRYRTLFEAIDAGFCIIEMRLDARPERMDYRFIEVNPAFEKLTGLSGAKGRWMREIAPAHEQHWFDTYARVALTGEAVRFESAADALGRWYDVHAFRVGEPGAHRVAILFNDISDRRHAEMALRQSETYWRELFEQLREGFVIGEVIRDSGGRVVDFRYLELNAAWEALLGHRRSSTLGRTVRQLIPDLDDAWLEDIARAVDSGAPVAFTRPAFDPHRWYAGRIHRLDDDRFAMIFSEVTEQRRADEQARRLAALAEQSSDFVGICEPDGWMVFLNRAGCQMVGLPGPAAAPSTRIIDYFAREEREKVVSTVLPAVRGKGAWEGMLRFRDLGSGALLPVLFNIFVLHDAQGRVAGHGILARDMQESQKAEARRNALLELGDRLRDMRDPLDMAATAAEIAGRTMAVDRAAYGRFAARRTLVVERDWAAPGLPSIAGEHVMRGYGSLLGDMRQGRAAVVPDVRLDTHLASRAAELEARQIRALIVLPVLENGIPVALFCIGAAKPRAWEEEEVNFLRDLTDRTLAAIGRRQAEIGLQALADRLELLVAERTRERDRLWDLSDDLLAVADYQGRVLRVSPSCCRLTGKEEAELLSTPYSQLMHPDEVADVMALLARMRDDGQTIHLENRVKGDDGWRWVAWTITPEPGGERMLCIGRDFTTERLRAEERDRLEDQLRQSQKMEAVGQLTGGLAHDFNNLLTGISGALELLHNHAAQGRFRDLDRYIAMAQSATRRAAALTHRLLAFARRQTLEPRPTDVNQLIADMEDLVRRTAGPAITLEVREEDTQWPVLVDPNQLENALLNLCINARDAMPGGGRLLIETANLALDEASARERDLPQGEYVSLCVTDNGTGMTPEVMAKAFDPFFTTKPLGQGTGLGLSMIYGFVRQSGGQVRITSRVGEGTRVCLYLPRYEGTVEKPKTQDSVARSLPVAHGETVLVVDDEPSIRVLVVEVLQDLGYNTIEAADAATGLQVLTSDVRIDLLLTDVGLPGAMNGREMVDAARTARPNLKVVFITGYTESSVIGEGRAGPGVHVMVKPFTMDALAARVRELIGRT
nr:PAS domain S-box protein [Roseomonas marmotae]